MTHKQLLEKVAKWGLADGEMQKTMYPESIWTRPINAMAKEDGRDEGFIEEARAVYVTAWKSGHKLKNAGARAMDEANVRFAKMSLQRYKTLDAAKAGLRRDSPTRHPNSYEWKEAKRLLAIDKKALAAAMKERYGNPGLVNKWIKATAVKVSHGRIWIKR